MIRVGLLAFACLLGMALSPAAFAEESRLDHVLRTRLLQVCYWPDYYGVSYRNPRTGELTGIDIEMARALASDLGVSLRFVESSFASLIPDLTSRRCDVAMFAVGITDERKRHLAFTEPYLASDIYAITTQGNRRLRDWADIDRPGTVVAVSRGTVHETIMRNRLKHATLRVVDTPHAREQDVQAGRADVFMTDYPYSRRMLATSDWARLIEPGGTFHVTPYGYAVVRGDPRWQQRLDGFVAQIKRDGRLLAAARRHQLEPIVLVVPAEDGR